MCGVVGVLSLGQSDNIKNVAMQLLFTELLILTEERGKDATGVSSLFADGMYYIQKGGVNSEKFIQAYGEEDVTYQSFLKRCSTYGEENNTHLKILLGHCRKSSVGGATLNVNNHPIKVNEIVGVHNGTLANHDQIFQNLGCKRDGSVDTEAIMRLLNYYTNNCTEPFTLSNISEVARRLEGSYAVLAFNGNNPNQLCFTRKQRPLEFCFIKEYGGIFVIASERVFLTKALARFNYYANLISKNGMKPIDLYNTEVHTVVEDFVGIINIESEITENTTIGDLVISRDSMKDVKIWKSPVVVKTYYGNQYHGTGYTNNYGTAGKKNDTNVGKTTDTKTASTGTGTGTGVSNETIVGTGTGKVFCKKLGKYIPDNIKKVSQDLSSVIITLGENTLNDHKTGEEIKITSANVTPVISTNTPVKIIINEVEMDDSIAEVMRAAKAQEEYLKRYKSTLEVASDLGVEDSTTLESLPTSVFANRLKEVMFVKGFIAGSAWAKNTLSKAEATKTIRVLKAITIVAFNTINRLTSIITLNSPTFVTKSATEECIIHNAFSESIVDNKPRINEITQETFETIFTKGDILEEPSIGILKDCLFKEKKVSTMIG